MLALNSWSGLFVGIGVIRYGYLIVNNHTRYYAGTILAGAVLNIALNLVFVPRYGGMAAAAATLAAQAIACYLSCFFFRAASGARMAYYRSPFYPGGHGAKRG